MVGDFCVFSPLSHVSLQRMALSYLIGSAGHFGQTQATGNSSDAIDMTEDSALSVSKSEAELMVELLGNTLANRAKEGPGGYSAATFNTKWVMFSIRCLLTHTMNQLAFVNIMGSRVNTLMMRVLAEHAIMNNTSIDPETAEYAVFSLYLQSNYGFKSRFLPAVFGSEKLFVKVLTSYIHKDDITPAGRHAADQLLLRSKYLRFKGIEKELILPPSSIRLIERDFCLSGAITDAAESIIVEKRGNGAKPRDDVFDRPILQSRTPKQKSAFLDSNSTERVHHSALLAVQDLSFGSSQVRHMEAIDDVLMANNIAASASGERSESYNYTWSWKDSGGEIQKNLERQQSKDSSSMKKFVEEDGPTSIFGFTCGSLCAVDTSVPMP